MSRKRHAKKPERTVLKPEKVAAYLRDYGVDLDAVVRRVCKRLNGRRK